MHIFSLLLTSSFAVATEDFRLNTNQDEQINNLSTIKASIQGNLAACDQKRAKVLLKIWETNANIQISKACENKELQKSINQAEQQMQMVEDIKNEIICLENTIEKYNKQISSLINIKYAFSGDQTFDNIKKTFENSKIFYENVLSQRKEVLDGEEYLLRLLIEKIQEFPINDLKNATIKIPTLNVLLNIFSESIKSLEENLYSCIHELSMFKVAKWIKSTDFTCEEGEFPFIHINGSSYSNLSMEELDVLFKEADACALKD